HQFEPLKHVKTHLQHVNVVVVVLDIKDLGHEAASGTSCDRRMSVTRRRTMSMSWAGLKEFFKRIVSTPEFSRARSAAVRSRAVITITGMFSHTGRACSAVMN